MADRSELSNEHDAIIIEITPPDAIESSEDNSSEMSRHHLRIPPLPAITSGHHTRLPSTASFQVITQSFGTSIEKQPSLWPPGEGFELVTPNGVLRIQGTTLPENNTLQQYVARELGPEGLKHLTGLVDVYQLLTLGSSQKQDVQVTAKQILQRIGREGHADDKDEQGRLLNTALYLARTFVSTRSSSRTTQKRYTPLLVLESVSANDETITLEYHLGQEFFDALFGSRPQHYAIPTARVMGYHAGKSQQELLLTFYLGNRLAVGKGRCSIYFTTLCIESALYTPAELEPGEYGRNRTRNAQQVIYALERMEQDGLIQRSAHPDIDTVLAVNACLEATSEEQLSPATTQRISGQIRTFRLLKANDKKQLNAKRRVALQRLLNLVASREEIPEEIPAYGTRLTFTTGPLLHEKREKQGLKQTQGIEKKNIGG